jgi:integrase
MPEFTLGRLRGGFAVSWQEHGRRRRFQLKARSRKEAEALDVVRRETAAPGDLSVAAIWEAYREDRRGRPIADAMKYVPTVLEHFGALRPDQITAEHCRAFTARRRADGRRDGTIWTELGHLRTALMWAQKRRLIALAPHIERPAKPAPRDRWLTHAEVSRLLDAATIPHVRLAILLMLSTGARVGAILDLEWRRVDLDRRQIDLRVSAEGPRKGRAVVPINAGLHAALAEAREAALTDYVIEWGAEPVRSIRKGFHTAAMAAKLPGVGVHVLRHTAGVHMAAAGVPMEQIGQYLGHSNVAVTYSVYARYAPEHLADAAAALDFGSANRSALRKISVRR